MLKTNLKNTISHMKINLECGDCYFIYLFIFINKPFFVSQILWAGIKYNYQMQKLN